MNREPLTPLVKRADDPFERALLRAGQRERAPRGTDRRLLAALGVGGGGALSALLARSGVKLGTKGLLATLAVSLAAVVAATWTVSSSEDGSPEPSAETVASPPGPPVPAPPSVELHVEALPSTRVEDLPSSPAPVKTASKTVGAATPQPTVEVAGDLAREVELVRTARSALARGEADDALRTLDVHDREFPAGTLRPESRVLRIEALVRAGGSANTASANRLADAFLAEHPSGPQARRVRAVLGRDR